MTIASVFGRVGKSGRVLGAMGNIAPELPTSYPCSDAMDRYVKCAVALCGAIQPWRAPNGFHLNVMFGVHKVKLVVFVVVRLPVQVHESARRATAGSVRRRMVCGRSGVVPFMPVGVGA